MKIDTSRAEKLELITNSRRNGAATKVLPLKKTPGQDAFKHGFSRHV